MCFFAAIISFRFLFEFCWTFIISYYIAMCAMWLMVTKNQTVNSLARTNSSKMIVAFPSPAFSFLVFYALITIALIWNILHNKIGQSLINVLGSIKEKNKKKKIIGQMKMRVWNLLYMRWLTSFSCGAHRNSDSVPRIWFTIISKRLPAFSHHTHSFNVRGVFEHLMILDSNIGYRL